MKLRSPGHKPTWPLRAHLATWRRVRRYAVPGWMIAAATGRRLAGDWAGACAAARITVEDGLLRRAVELGVEAAVLDDLRHLAPDLLRGYLPRASGGRAAIEPGTEIVLASYRGTPLSLYAPAVEAPQIPVLALRTTPDPRRRRRALPRIYWDSRAVDGLRRRCGDAVRTGFFAPDGHRLDPADRAPSSDIERLEWATRQWDAGAVGPALAAYGIEAVEPDPRWSQLPVALDRLAGLPKEASQTPMSGPPKEGVVIGFGVYPGPAIELRLADRGQVVRPARPGQLHRLRWADPELWQRLPDWDLLRFGLIEPSALHPLVHQALFPSAPPPAARPDRPPDPVRIRCRDGWHEASVADGQLRLPHAPEELRREELLHALGAPLAGCASVRNGWSTGQTLPRGLRELREHLFMRAFHSDAPGVLALLDGGFDPHVAAGGGRTLLHYLAFLDHRELLPRLLAAGLDINRRDGTGRTPLDLARGHGADALAADLVRAGARSA